MRSEFSGEQKYSDVQNSWEKGGGGGCSETWTPRRKTDADYSCQRIFA